MIEDDGSGYKFYLLINTERINGTVDENGWISSFTTNPSSITYTGYWTTLTNYNTAIIIRNHSE